MDSRTLTLRINIDFRQPDALHTLYISLLPVADDAAFDLLTGNQVAVYTSVILRACVYCTSQDEGVRLHGGYH